MHFKNLLLLSTFIFCTHLCCAQVYLQLERYNSTKTIKFYAGDILEFRLKEFPETWRKEEIVDLVPDQQLIVFESTYYHIDELKNIRLRFPAVRKIGERMMQFSAAWFVYGAIASLASDTYNIGPGDVIVGGSFVGVGFLLRDFFSKKKIKLGKRRRLRVMDTRFDPLHGY